MGHRAREEKEDKMILNWLIVIGVLVLCVIAYGIMEYLSND